MLIGVGVAICTLRVVCAQSWNAELDNGRVINVDPNTNRAVIQSGAGAGAPLWDGVHRLNDGSVITVRSGLMVPNEDVMSLRRGEEPQARVIPVLSRACDDLVVKTCGLTGECDGTEPCDLATQLRATQWQTAGRSTEETSWAASQCESSLADEQVFPACEPTLPGTTAPCRQLVELLCGETKRCVASEACRVAMQLLELAQQAERDSAADATLAPERQCQEMLVEHALFPPCR